MVRYRESDQLGILCSGYRCCCSRIIIISSFIQEKYYTAKRFVNQGSDIKRTKELSDSDTESDFLLYLKQRCHDRIGKAVKSMLFYHQGSEL